MILQLQRHCVSEASLLPLIPSAFMEHGLLFSGCEANPDVLIVTSSRRRIPAHSTVLASASEVLKGMIEKPAKRGSSLQKLIAMPGVACDAVSAFVRFLYTSRCSEEDLSKYGIHLLVLSHVYAVPQMKRTSSRAVARGLTSDNAIDILQIARLCDAPDLYLRCMRLISDRFKSVENSEGWRFMQANDPWLELEILQFIDDAEFRKKRTKRRKEEQRVYLELCEAMVCLEHICGEGCTGVGPFDASRGKTKNPCLKFDTCQGVQLSLKHFASCVKKVRGGCGKCRSMWQLLRLHACLCEDPGSCKVPLCRQFKLKMQQKRTRDDALWRTLVRRVASANAIQCLVPSIRCSIIGEEKKSMSEIRHLSGSPPGRFRNDMKHVAAAEAGQVSLQSPGLMQRASMHKRYVPASVECHG